MDNCKKQSICRRRGVTILNKEREVIRRIVESCDLEAKQKFLLHPLRQATKRAAEYAKVSERTVKRIREEIKSGTEWADEEYCKTVRCFYNFSNIFLNKVNNY